MIKRIFNNLQCFLLSFCAPLCFFWGWWRMARRSEGELEQLKSIAAIDCRAGCNCSSEL